MRKIIHYIGLDVHKDSITPQNSTEVRRYGIIGTPCRNFREKVQGAR